MKSCTKLIFSLVDAPYFHASNDSLMVRFSRRGQKLLSKASVLPTADRIVEAHLYVQLYRISGSLRSTINCYQTWHIVDRDYFDATALTSPDMNPIEKCQRKIKQLSTDKTLAPDGAEMETAITEERDVIP